MRGQARYRHACRDPDPAGRRNGRVAPFVLGLDAKEERLSRPPPGGGHGLPDGGRPGDDRHIELAIGKRIEIARRLHIGHDDKIAPRLGECLHQQTGTAAAPVTDADGDGLARAEIAAMLGDGQDFAPRALPATTAVIQRQPSLAIALCADIVRRRRILCLHQPAVADPPPGDADAAGVVQSERPDSIGQREALEGPHLHRVGRTQGGVPQNGRVVPRQNRRGIVAHQIAGDGKIELACHVWCPRVDNLE